MCRFIAYLGQPVSIDTLVCQPRRSLLPQRLRATEAGTEARDPGFGLGWYGSPVEPAVFRDGASASQQQARALCARLRSGLFFARASAAQGKAPGRQDGQPFQLGRHLFMVSGQIGGYVRLRRAIEAMVPDHLFELRAGATDAELLFLLVMARLELGEDPIRALVDVFEEIARRLQRAGVAEPLHFCAALADGKALYAVRLANDGQPPPLYLRSDDHGTLIASEPLDDDASRWTLVPPGAVVRVTRSAYMVQQAQDLVLQHTAFG